jgi:3-methyl-2-oxobutanoate hydroxymethyltransferase
VSFEENNALLQAKKWRHEKIVMVTAFDYYTAVAAEAAGVDMILVGDSAATTVLGKATTQEVTLEEMLVITRAVGRGKGSRIVVGDLPFGSYEASDELAVGTATRFVQAGCDAVKMEGAATTVDRASAVIAAGIPVMGHVGLLPQQLGPGDQPRVQGRTATAAIQLLEDALNLQLVGCFALIFEAVPALVVERLMPHIDIPVIGIGAGTGTSGQVLVAADLLGLTTGRLPRFVRQYASLREVMTDAFARFGEDVRSGSFPGADHVYRMDGAELSLLERALAECHVGQARPVACLDAGLPEVALAGRRAD